MNIQVKQLHGIDPNAMPDSVLHSEQPIVLKGFCQDWPLVKAGLVSKQQAARELQGYYSGKPVHACYGSPENNGRIFYNDTLDGFNFKGANIHLDQVLDTIFKHQDDPNPPTVYVASTEVNNWFPGLIADHKCTIPDVSPLTSIWLGNQTRIAAHFDFPANIACNLVGQRKFTLFPPDQISNLYIGPLNFAPGGQAISMVDFAAPDFNQYPKFTTALEHAITLELEPGDALLLPSMWWHHVEALSSFNILMSHWWRNTPPYLGRPDNALSAAILAIRSLPKAQRLAWKHIFNHYIFDDELAPLEQIPDRAKAELTTPLDELSARQLRADLQNKLKR